MAENKEINNQLSAWYSNIGAVTLIIYICFFIIQKMEVPLFVAYFPFSFALINLIYTLKGLLKIFRNKAQVSNLKKQYISFTVQLIFNLGLVFLIGHFLYTEG